MKEKIKRNIICNSRTVLRAIFCVALLTIGWKLTPKEVSITQDPVVYFVVFAVLAGISLTVRIRENEKFQKIFSVFLLVAVPMICFYNTEYIVGNDLFNITPVAIVLNYCVYLAVFLIFQLLLNQTKWAISLGMVIFCLFAVIDAFVGIFRGVMIRTSDIFAMNTAMNVMGEYEFILTERMVIGVLVTLSIVFLSFHCTFKEKNLKKRGKRQILRSLPNYAPLFIGGAYCNIQLEVLSTMA